MLYTSFPVKFRFAQVTGICVGKTVLGGEVGVSTAGGDISIEQLEIARAKINNKHEKRVLAIEQPLYW